jgi:cobalt/nickel transport system permease protein
MHHQIDSLAYTNRLRYLPPEHKLSFAAALFGLGYLAPPPIQLTIAAWLAVWIVGYVGIPISAYGKLQAIPLTFWLTSMPALVIGGVWLRDLAALQSDVLQGMTIGNLYLYLSRQGLHQGITLLSRSLALTSCMYFVLLTVPFIEVLRVLQQLRCPTLIIELLSLMYRFIFVLTQTVFELLMAQQARVGYCGWRTSLRSFGILIGQLLKQTLDNYRQLALGLSSRGFNGELRVLHTRRHQPNLRYTLEAVGGWLLLAMVTGWQYIHGI